MLPLSLQICLASSIAVCYLLLGFFYATPGLGHTSSNGSLNCVCKIIAKTGPHFVFLLHIVCGLLLLSLFARACNEGTLVKQTLALAMSIVFFICFTGLLSFDIVNFKDLHGIFTVLVYGSVLVFSVFVLNWDNRWHLAGAIIFVVAFGVLHLYRLLVYYAQNEEDDTTIYLQLVCISALVFVLCMYIYLS